MKILLSLLAVLVCLSAFAEEKEETGVLVEMKKAGKRVEGETKRVIEKTKKAAKAFDEHEPAKEKVAEPSNKET